MIITIIYGVNQESLSFKKKVKKMAAEANNEDDSSFGDSLSSAFNFVAKGALFYVGFGLLDLALWHFDPGGVAFFDAVKDPILKLIDVTGVSDGLNALATMLGGGTEQMALNLGGSELSLGGDMGNAFFPDY